MPEYHDIRLVRFGASSVGPGNLRDPGVDLAAQRRKVGWLSEEVLGPRSSAVRLVSLSP